MWSLTYIAYFFLPSQCLLAEDLLPAEKKGCNKNNNNNNKKKHAELFIRFVLFW